MSETSARVVDLVRLVADALLTDATVACDEREAEITVTVDADDLGPFIGRDGATIDAVQLLAQRVGGRDRTRDGQPQRIVVDAGDYRAGRARVVEDLAGAAADEAVRTGRPVAMEPMSAMERRIAHEHLRDRAEVSTASEGEDRRRHLVVSPTDD